MMCPLAQKQATQMPELICTTSARSTKDVSVMLCLNTQVWEGRDMTLACFSEHSTAYWFSFSSWDVDGETDTGRLLRTLSRSSPLAGALSSHHGSKAEWRRDPVESSKAIRRMLPFNLTRVPVQRVKQPTFKLKEQPIQKWQFAENVIQDVDDFVSSSE